MSVIKELSLLAGTRSTVCNASSGAALFRWNTGCLGSVSPLIHTRRRPLKGGRHPWPTKEQSFGQKHGRKARKESTRARSSTRAQGRGFEPRSGRFSFTIVVSATSVKAVARWMPTSLLWMKMIHCTWVTMLFSWPNCIMYAFVDCSQLSLQKYSHKKSYI